MQRIVRLSASVAAATLCLVCQGQQVAHSPDGHWQGSMKIQNQEEPLAVDLSKNSKGEWIGTMGMPKIGVADVPVTQISVNGNEIQFSAPSFPGSPTVDLMLSGGGKTLSGTLTAGQQKAPVTLQFSGEAKVKLPAPNSALAKQFEGDWHGTLDAGSSRTFRVTMRLARGADGRGAGTLVSVDRGSTETPLINIFQEGKSLQFEIQAYAGKYRGTINDAGTEIDGQFEQMGQIGQLNFTRGGFPTGNSTLSKAFEGTWKGAMDFGSAALRIELVVKLSRGADGTALGVLSTSEANSREAPLTSVVQKDKNLEFEVPILKAKFSGTLSADGNSVTGRWWQIGVDGAPLTIKRQ